MKKYMLTAALAATSLIVMAQGKNMVITTSDGTRHVFPTEQVADVTFNDTPDYTSVHHLIHAQYSASGERGTYLLTLGTGEPDPTGEPERVGDFQVTLAFTAPVSDDALNAILAPGTYTVGNGAKEGTFDISRSGLYLRTEEGDDGVELLPLVGGDIHVAYDRRGDYTIKMELTTMLGTSHTLLYEGPIGFTPALGESGAFDEDINVTFEGAQMRYYGSWFYPFADDGLVQLYTGTFDENGAQTEGYWMCIDMNMPKKLDPWDKNVTLADGVYEVETREKVENSTYLPYTYIPGKIVEAFGISGPNHTYITHKSTNGVTRLGLVKDGKITVSGNGSRLEFELTMDNGKIVKGQYSGKINVGNFHDYDAPEYPDLAEDHVLDWYSGTVSVGWNDGPTIKPGLNTYMVVFTDPAYEKGDYLCLYLLTDKDVVADGTYTINETFGNFTGIKGIVDYGGGILYSWYSDLSSTDSEGVQEVLAPIEGGTVKVSTIDANNKKFEFDLVTKEGKKVSGVYEGLFVDGTTMETSARTAGKALKTKVK